MNSIKDIANLALICFIFFLIFGILGVQLFKGLLYHCVGSDLTNITNRIECENSGNLWVNSKLNYDNLAEPLLSLFVAASMDGWVDMMHDVVDGLGGDMQPVQNYNQVRILFFVTLIMVVGFFVLNMFAGVLVVKYHETHVKLKAEIGAYVKEQQRKEKNSKASQKLSDFHATIPQEYQGWRRLLYKFLSSKYFIRFMIAVILLNVATMAIEYHGMPSRMIYVLNYIQIGFTLLFAIEACMKILAIGYRSYIYSKWNKLDLIVVILSLAQTAFELAVEENAISMNPSFVRLVRIVKVVRGLLLISRLFKWAKGLRALMHIFKQSVSDIGNLTLVFTLFLFIYAALGVQLFSEIECSKEKVCTGINEHVNFSNFLLASLTLIQVSTGDNWNEIFQDTIHTDCFKATNCKINCCVRTVFAAVYFSTFFVIVKCILLNLVVAMLVSGYQQNAKEEGLLKVTMDEIIQMRISSKWAQ